ncbi:hypothetical protein M5K25_025629 [Dendrobium thyrsiflorum]|uniref:Uncharacterized protein n=1 Tax=Dendrobium thyrsiflorum TaxID=117978 RepID=A0ABD0U9S1_DENTH
MPVSNIIRQTKQRRGLCRIKPLKLQPCIPKQLFRKLPRSLQTHQLRIRRLVACQILSSRLAQFLRRFGHIKNIINHLKQQPNAPRVPSQPLNLLLQSAADYCPYNHRRLQQHRRLVNVYELEPLKADEFFLEPG